MSLYIREHHIIINEIVKTDILEPVFEKKNTYSTFCRLEYSQATVNHSVIKQL